MIPIPQRDEDENDDQAFISPQKDKEMKTFQLLK